MPNSRARTAWSCREVHMDMPSSAPVGGLIDRSVANVGPSLAVVALDHAKYLHHAGRPAFLVLTALGVVYGDIATSPLYAFQVALAGIGPTVPTPAVAPAIPPLTFWRLLPLCTLKSSR